MGSSIFGLTEELELELGIKFIKIGKQIESKIFIIGCTFISIFKIFNIITLYQFLCLFMFYLFWLNCSILYNTSVYSKIEKKNTKMN
tara:strand:+ start:11 stop:271 length:261 start_codon:yes stop_codon:yes gene_type:complete